MIVKSIKEIRADLLYDKTNIVITLDNNERTKALKWLDTLSTKSDKEYEINIKRHYDKRSLNANSYLRVLERKIADVIGASLVEIHNDMLAKYGQPEVDNDGNMLYSVIPASTDVRQYEDIHLNPTGKYFEKNEKKYQWYEIIRPSHTYNTREMAILLDGVIDEAKNLNIEVLSPDELARMKGMAE